MNIFYGLCVIVAVIFHPSVHADERTEQTERVRSFVKTSTPLPKLQEAVSIRQDIEDQLLANSDDPNLLISIAAEPHLAELQVKRLGVSASWAMPSPLQKAYARELLERSNRIATQAWTSSLANDRESRALRSSAAGLRGVAMLGVLRLDDSDRWTDSSNLDDINQLLEESLQLARGPRGVIFQAAAIVAAAKGKMSEAQSLLKQARAEPAGLDPLTLLLLEKSFEAGGVNAYQRINAAEAVFSTKLSPAERLFLMEWRARAGYESGESRDKTIQAITSRLDDLPEAERRILLRPVSKMLTSIPGQPSDDPVENFGRARAAIDRGAAEPAFELFRTVGENAPQNYLRAEAWLELAQRELSAGNREAAVECLVDAITSEPTHPSSQKAAQLAIRISKQLGSEVGTTQTLAKVLTNHPDRNAWRIVIAQDAHAQDQLKKAISTWNEIPTLAPESIEARIRMAETLLSSGDELKRSTPDIFTIIDLLDESLKEHSDESGKIRAQSLRIQALLASNRLREAARVADELPNIKDTPPDVRIFSVTAAISAYGQADRKQDAANILDDFGKIDPEGRTTFANAYVKNLATTLRTQIRDGDSKKAVANAQSAFANGIIPSLDKLQYSIADNPWPTLYAAFVLRLAGQSNDAIAYCDAILKEHPGTSEALLEKAEAMFAQGGPPQWQAAFTIFKQIRVGSQRGSRMWWQSELRQLEILEKMEQQLDAIGPRVNRLRKENPDLGGGEIRRGLEALQLRANRRAIGKS